MSKSLKLEVILAAVDKMTRPMREALQGSTSLGKAVKETRDQLKGLERQQNLLKNFNEVGRALAVTRAQLKNAMAGVKDLREQMALTPNPTKQMTAALKAAESTADGLRLKHGKLATQEIRLRSAVTEAGLSTTKLSAQQRDLKSKADEVNKTLTAQSQRLDAVNKRMQKVHAAQAQYAKTMALRDKIGGAGVAMAGAGAATLAPVALSVREYAKAETAATDLRVAMMKAGGKVPEDFRKVNELTEKLGNRLPGTTAELQGMMTMLQRQGMSTKAILGGLGEATAYIAVQMKMPYEEAARFSSQLADATRTTEGEMMGLMDVIQKTYYTGVDPDWMLQGFSKLGAGMDIIKMKGLEGAKALAPLLAMANQAGMTDGGSAGNAFRKVFQSGMDKKKMSKGNAALKDAGAGFQLDFTDGKGEFAGLDNMYKQLDKLKGLSTQDRGSVLKAIFGDDSETLQALTLLIDKGKSGYDEMQQKMEAQADLKTRVEAQLGTLQNMWDAAAGTFTNLLVKLGESIGPELKAITEWLGEVAEVISTWAKENPVLAGAIMKFVAVVGLLAVALGGISLAAAAILGPLAMAKLSFSILGIQGAGAITKLGAAGKFLMASPLFLAIGLLAVAAFMIWKNWGPISTFFQERWAAVGAAFTGAISFIQTTLSGWWAATTLWFGGIATGFADFGRNIMLGLVNGIVGAVGMVKDAVSGVGASVTSWFKEKLGINSPSRVFAELGGYTMDGLRDGITAGQSGPLAAATSAVKGLAGIGAGMALGAGVAMAGDIPIDSRPPVTAGTQAAAAAAAPITITVNAAPGMDERLLAQMVAQQIERIDRERSARSRGRLSDSD